MISIDDFSRVDLKVGRIISVSLIPDAKFSTHKLEVDFGSEIGIKKSCARLINYSLDELKNKLVVGVTNLEPRQIGKNISEVLVIGVPDDKGECLLLDVNNYVKLGARVY